MVRQYHSELKIDSSLEAIAEVRDWVALQASTGKFDAETIIALKLAVSEALANVIQHAYHGRAGDQIHISLTFDEEKVSLTVRDFGRKFDLQEYRPPDLGFPSGQGGYGVFLIREVMDEVSYDTGLPKGTRINMVKYRLAGKRD